MCTSSKNQFDMLSCYRNICFSVGSEMLTGRRADPGAVGRCCDGVRLVCLFRVLFVVFACLFFVCLFACFLVLFVCLFVCLFLFVTLVVVLEVQKIEGARSQQSSSNVIYLVYYAVNDPPSQKNTRAFMITRTQDGGMRAQ